MAFLGLVSWSAIFLSKQKTTYVEKFGGILLVAYAICMNTLRVSLITPRWTHKLQDGITHWPRQFSTFFSNFTRYKFCSDDPLVNFVTLCTIGIFRD